MSDADLQDENGINGTMESKPSMVSNPMGGGGDSIVWDPESKSYVRVNNERKPDRFQVPGIPTVSEDYSMQQSSPETSGVFASTDAPNDQAERFRATAQEFWDLSDQTDNPSEKRRYQQKSDYYKQLAETYDRVAIVDDRVTRPDTPASQDATDVYQDRADKPRLNTKDDSFPSMISSHTPKVTGTMPTKNSYSPGDKSRYTLGADANLTDCPNEHCGGVMADHDGESVCHDCGHKEKVHYAGEKEAAFLAPLIGEAAGALAGGAEALDGGSALKGGFRALQVGNLMNNVMNSGGGEQEQSAPEEAAPAGEGSAASQETYAKIKAAWHIVASSLDEEDDGANGFDNSGHDSEPDSGNKGSEGQDTAADELDSDVDTGTGGDQGKMALEIFQVAQPHLEKIQHDDDSHDDPIGKAVHEMLEAVNPGYLKHEGRMEMSKIAGGTCPTCHIDLTQATNCGGPSNVQCPVGLPRSGEAAMGAMVGQNPGTLGMPVSKTADYMSDQMQQWNQTARSVDPDAIDAMRDWLIDYTDANPENKWGDTRWNTPSMSPDGVVLMAMDDFYPGGYQDFADGYRQQYMEQEPGSYDEQEREADMGFGAGSMPEGNIETWASIKEAAKRPKMCPVHEQMVNYALTLKDPAAAVQALSGQLFGEHSCQGGYEMLNKNGQPTKCRYKPEMVTQEYWDAKEQAAAERKLQREQMQELEAQMVPHVEEQPVEQVFEDGNFGEQEPERTLVGGPAFEEQEEQEEIHGDFLPTVEEDGGAVVQQIDALDPIQTEEDYIPAEVGQDFQMAASYKWSGPAVLDAPAPTAGPDEMFADNPPEELPAENVSGDSPLDSQGAPIEVGQTYEVTSAQNADYVPDRYTVTGVDPNFIQIEVEPQEGQPFGFKDTISTAQIKAEGLRFTPASDDANARGDVATDDDNTKGSDDPTGVTDLDTGGNSHASKTGMFGMDTGAPDPNGHNFHDGWKERMQDRSAPARHAPDCTCPDCAADLALKAEVEGGRHAKVLDAFLAHVEHVAWSDLDATPSPDNMYVEDPNWNGGPTGDDMPEGDLYEQLLALSPEEREVLFSRVDAESNAAESAPGVGIPGEPSLSDPREYEEGGEDPLEHARRSVGSDMTGNPNLDWLNEGTPAQKTAGRDYSLGEQRSFVNESGSARNLDKLSLEGTHYPTAADEDPYADSLWG